ncbi:tail fiber domain-containing protein, partial [Desulfobacterales bacterium HSG17]|nr:tail fiber domain-containing protein [Desulfobacterales bacterium HSG17]
TNGQVLKFNGTAWECSAETDSTITDATIKDGVDASELKSAAGKYLAYKPNNAACTDGQVLKWDNTNGRWACGADTDTTYTAGTGLTLTGTAFSLNYTETDPTITDATIKDGVDASELKSAAGKYLAYKPNNVACTDGQILVWNSVASQWECGSSGAGLILPQAADVSALTAEGQITWDSDDDKLYVGDGTTAKVIGSSAFERAGNVVHSPGMDDTLFVFGSTQIDDDPTTLKDDGRMFFLGCTFRAGFVSGEQWNQSNLGGCSAAMGYNTIASGAWSTAMGDNTIASGAWSTAMGSSTDASGEKSTAMGYNTTASGIASTAMGYNTTASEEASTAMGLESTASGLYSTAMGALTTASGWGSTAMGSHTTASGSASTAMGGSTIASGWGSTAMGLESTASGYYSMAMGSYTTAKAFCEIVFGTYNTNYTPINVLDWDSNDRLFVIGNGSMDSARSDALLMLKDGTTTFKGPAIYFNETATNTPMFTFDTTTGEGTATTWTQTSDRNVKENFEEVNTRNVLETLSEIPIETWNFKNNDESIRHMGPMAQDFRAAFGLGKDDKTIATVDADGVAFAAIQGLYDMLKEQQKINEEQQEVINELKAQIATCKK